MTSPTPLKYALAELKAERFPQIEIYSVAGDFWLADRDWALLAHHSYKTKADAMTARSKVLDVAGKRFWKAAA